MRRLTRYPLQQRMIELGSLEKGQLRQLIHENSNQPKHIFPPSSQQQEQTIKEEILSFLPGSAFSSLKTTFDYAYRWLPKFTFPSARSTAQTTKLEVAITSILIGNFLNRLMTIDNQLFKRWMSDKYLVLTADFFHIKGSVYGSSLNQPLVSYYISRLESDLAKLSLVTGKAEPLSYHDFEKVVEWKAAPLRYGYGSLHALQGSRQQDIQSGQNLGYNLGVLKCLQEQQQSMGSRSFFKTPGLRIADVEEERLSLVVQTLISELQKQLVAKDNNNQRK